MDHHTLNGKRALVGGSTQGIGRAAAFELASRGAAVTLLARDKAALERACSELPGTGHGIRVADFHDNDAVARAAADELKERGPVHVLVNNTGGPAAGPIVAATPDAFLVAFRAHLVNNQILATTFLPGMKDAGFGRIVNVVSTSVREPIAGLGVSNTVRAAVAGWAKTLSGEVARFGITVNNVLPGYTKTSRLESIISGRAKATGRPADDIADEMLRQVPAGRFAESWEVAAAIGVLASPAGGYITGVSLPVDGGRIASL
jgi:3-oxoacyl-[acyl-carrier protein] reductase